MDILRSADVLIMACEHDRLPDVACGGIGDFKFDSGHRQVLPGRAGKVLRTGYRLDSGELVGFRAPEGPPGTTRCDPCGVSVSRW